jgi:hypothetical protein
VNDYTIQDVHHMSMRFLFHLKVLESFGRSYLNNFIFDYMGM